jgi:3'-phosphoadenosine 5'-phosphosulfate sulfotransferase (PAPS reductase)/FAD synthetase
MKKVKVLVAFSGGKDSLASLIWAVKKYRVDSCEAVFCDTGWEHEITYQHIKEVVEKIGVKLVTVKSKKYDGFLDMAKKKGRFPSTKARFCTEQLKAVPMIDYVLSQECHLIIIQGIRADESASRSKMQENCSYFRYYLEPYKTDKDGKPKTQSYRKKEVLAWRAKYADDIIRPVFKWTGQEVMAYILENGFKPNPLYYQGFNRVGCFPCIMCRHAEIKQIADKHPEYLKRLSDGEKEAGSSFFPPDYIPKWAQTNQDKNGKKFPSLKNVIDYVTDDPNQQSMFKEPDTDGRCMSFYAICE